MNPTKLHIQYLVRAAGRPLRRMAHAIEVRRHRAALRHHTDEMAQLSSLARCAAQASAWHAQRAAIATAHLRSMGALYKKPIHVDDTGDNASLRRQCAVARADASGLPGWVDWRLGVAICIVSGVVTVSGLWHLYAAIAR